MGIMNFRCLLFLAGAALALPACSNSSVIALNYVPHPARVLRGTPDFSLGKFVDRRGVPPQTLGSVRMPIGVKVDTLQTRLPISDIVRNAFGHGLETRGMLSADSKGRFIITGEVQDLRAQLLVHPYGHARIRVSLIEAASGRVLLTKVYEGERQSSAYRPGSGSPVPVLRELTSRALQDAVDRALDDREFRQRASGGTATSPRYVPGML